jgi:pseudaminic acid cytidylyltransferase
MKIAIIPARGGSRRIPRKNVEPFCGRPMIAWPIEAAKRTGAFDRIVVSTDDPEIARISLECGAEVPFVRPSELADEFTGTTAVIAHATRWLLAQNLEPTAVCCIYATAPLVQAADLLNGLRELESGNWQYVFSATTFPAPIFRSFRKSAAGGVEMFFPEHFGTRSQDLPEALHDAGQFYWGKPEAWIEERRIFDVHSMPIVLPRWRVQDIDDRNDWIIAERIFRQLEEQFK